MSSPSKKKGSARPFSLLVKPASADCNLRCDYCFYLEKMSLYPESRKHRMDHETLERLIAGYMRTRQPVYSFAWQGGEPTLMGLDFFRSVTSLQERYGRPGSTVFNGLQTNGVEIGDDFAEHLGAYRFLTGVSIDGPPELHNVYRKGAEGRGSYDRVIRGIESLQRRGAGVNGLVLVSRANAGSPEKVYRHLKELGLYHHQYIPCVEYDEQGNPLPWTIGGEEWGEFLIRLFDEWSRGDIGKVSIRRFEAITAAVKGMDPGMCTMGRNCTLYFVVEHSGDVYPCDFFVERELELGNIWDSSWEDLKKSKLYRQFGRRKNEWDPACASCPYLPLCAGDCLKHRPGSGIAPQAPAAGKSGRRSVLCAGWFTFFQKTLPNFHKIAQNI
jgi:uncharacterized protein